MTDDYFLSSLLPLLAVLMVLLLASMLSSGASKPDEDNRQTASIAEWCEGDDGRWNDAAYCEGR